MSQLHAAVSSAHPLCETTLNPCATSTQKPMLGTYRTLSATTNPTGKKRLDAGMKGRTIRDNAWKETGEDVNVFWCSVSWLKHDATFPKSSLCASESPLKGALLLLFVVCKKCYGLLRNTCLISFQHTRKKKKKPLGHIYVTSYGETRGLDCRCGRNGFWGCVNVMMLRGQKNKRHVKGIVTEK